VNNVFKCPSAAGWTGISTGSAGPPTTSVIYYPTDYGFNINEGRRTPAVYPGYTFSGVKPAAITYFTNNPSFGFNEAVNLATIQNPSGFLVIVDTSRPDKALSRGSVVEQYVDPTTGHAVSYDNDPNPGYAWVAQNGQAAVIGRHTDGANVGYSDGHVKFRKLNQLWRSKTDNDFRWDSTG
jgi:prepilin-type processing-associated H-X9-DG protein